MFQFAPDQASNFAAKYDLLFTVITALTVFFTVVVLSIVVFFAIKYRTGSKADRSRPQHENLRIEVAWSVPPLILGIIIFAWGASDFIELRRPPKNAVEIFVIGKQWMWHIQHPDGVREMNELHVPEGVPVKLTMISQDVIHAFYIPQFRVQYMVVPGHYTYEWFTPTKPGRYYLFCAMHCGTQHSEMGGYVYVLPKAKYAEWLANGGSTPKMAIRTLVDKGKDLYDQLQCASCHTNVDTERAPSLVALSGKQVKLTDGSTLADDNYLRESLIDPYSKLVAGYRNTMPDYRNQLTEEQIQSLIQYMKSLGLPPPPQAPASGAPTNQTTPSLSSNRAPVGRPL